MKISKHWLKEFINLEIGTEELVDQLTMAGLEVDSVDSVAPEFQGVKVGDVLETKPHPEADKLTICTIDVGESYNLSIICGAKNVRVNLKVAVAVIGAELPENFKIKKAKLRGVESFGMLCSGKELGLPNDIDGILELPNDAPIGQDIREYLGLNDEAIEIELTANRGDCLSTLGIAREIAAINRIDLIEQKITQLEFDKNDLFPILITAKDSCPHYAGRIIRGVNSKALTPTWIKERLSIYGIGSINFIVDVTNYVMLELGQPLHAFDLDKLNTQIEVRNAKAGEKLELLDGTSLDLEKDDLVIADKNKPVALAGVMGGAKTSVTDETIDIFLESAFFVPDKIAVQARKYKLQTDSSYRFERGVDYNLQVRALNRAAALIVEFAGGICGDLSEVTDETYLPKSSSIQLRFNNVTKILGFVISEKEIEDILTHLDLKFESADNGWLVTSPSWRFDINIEEDLVEEIIRIYGYHLMPEQKIVAELGLHQGASDDTFQIRKIHSLLKDLGYREAITYSFIDEKMYSLFSDDSSAVNLANPISSEQTVMRSTLWPGLIKVLQYNLQHQKQRIRVFETGLRFLNRLEGVTQQFVIAGLAYGELYPEQWGASNNHQVDFFDIKNDVTNILELYGIKDIEYAPADHKALHPNRSAEIIIAGKTIGLIGNLHPLVKQELNLTKSPIIFEIDLSFLINEIKPVFKSLSRFPKVERDIAIIVDKKITWSEIRQKIVDISGELLQNAYVFDVYCNENIGLDNRSVAIRLIFQSDQRTLVDAEIDTLVGQAVSVLQTTFNATLRG